MTPTYPLTFRMSLHCIAYDDSSYLHTQPASCTSWTFRSITTHTNTHTHTHTHTHTLASVRNSDFYSPSAYIGTASSSSLTQPLVSIVSQTTGIQKNNKRVRL